jgi:Gtp-binding protein of the ras superfamily involved in termination of M-phase
VIPMCVLTSLLQARRFAKAMRAALIFSSTSHSINVQKV